MPPIRHNRDVLGLADRNGTQVTMRVIAGTKATAVYMEASRDGVTASLNMSLGAAEVDALWEQLTYIRSLRGL